MIEQYVTEGQSIEYEGRRWRVTATRPGASVWFADLRGDGGETRSVAMPPAYTPGAPV